MRIYTKILLLLLIVTVCFAAQDVNVESLKISHITTIVKVTTSATALPSAPLAGRKVILVENITGDTVYLGNVNITANTAPTGGFQLISKGDSWKGDLTDDVVVYGIVAAGTVPLCIWEAN